MSLVVSPKTGRLIKTSSKEFSSLLADPNYKESVYNPANKDVGVVKSPKSSLSKNATSNSSLSKDATHKASLPPIPSPVISPKTKLPPLRSKTVSSSKSLPSLKAKPTPYSPPSPDGIPYSPSSPTSSLRDVEMPVSDEEHMTDIMTMPFYDIPTLEEVLSKTTQPALREKILTMIEEKRETEGRGIKTRGWSSRSPRRGRERHQLMQECGEKCFLHPEGEKFPICASPKLTGGKSVCSIDCGSIQAAKIRAAQWKYPEVEAKADILLKKCNAEGLKHFVPSSPKSSRSPRMSASMSRAGKMDKTRDHDKYGVVRRHARRAVLFAHGYDEAADDRIEREHLEKMDYDRHNRHHDRHHHNGWNHEDKYGWNHHDRHNHGYGWDHDEHHHDRHDRHEHHDEEHHHDRHDRYSWDHEDRHHLDRNDIKLPPSMSKNGKMDHDSEEKDCGCGK